MRTEYHGYVGAGGAAVERSNAHRRDAMATEFFLLHYPGLITCCFINVFSPLPFAPLPTSASFEVSGRRVVSWPTQGSLCFTHAHSLRHTEYLPGYAPTRRRGRGATGNLGTMGRLFRPLLLVGLLAG